MKEQLKATKYLRYVDDFALFSDDRAFLAEARLGIEAYLADLRLKIHPIKSQLFESCRGATFVGFRVLPDRIRVRNDNLKRARARLKRLQKAYARDHISFERLTQSVKSWAAHLKHGDTGYLREDIFRQLVFVRSNGNPGA